MVRLERGVHPLARRELDAGPLDPGRRISNVSLVFKLSPQQLRDRDEMLADVMDPGSPRYHRWLTPEEYAARFGARTDDLARATTWLTQQGLEVHGASRLGARVTFSGTVANLETAFRTEMRRYQVAGETHYAMATAPSVPADLADVVLGLHGTHDFYPRHVKPTRVRAAPQAVCPGGDRLCDGDDLGPPDWASVYDVDPLYSPGIGGVAINGAGVRIGIVGLAEIAQSDIDAFRTTYALPASAVIMTLVPGTGAPQGANGNGVEAILDTEWSGGIAPGAQVVYVFNGGDDGDIDDAVFYAIEENVAPILSESFAGCEEGATSSDADALGVFGSAANLLGITYLAAAGDSGAAACLDLDISGLFVNMPASFPGVTAVGGTEFPTGTLTYTGGTATGYSAAEQIWDESNLPKSAAAGGGGISIVYSRPSYQSAIATCPIVGALPVSGITPSAMREVPDVAFAAAASNNGYFVQCTFDNAAGDCSGTGGTTTTLQIGGTSASTPSFAGVVALLTQATGGGRLGNINPLLYTLQSTNPSAFHDITRANNEVRCTAGVDPGCPAGDLYGYAAATGYDCGSGLGSIDTAALVRAWVALTPTATTLTASPTSTSEGSGVALDATVDVTGGNPQVLGGTVTFAFQSYLANGDPDLSWTIATAPIAGGTTLTGSASAPSVAIPPGMVNPADQAVDVFATYDGDATHLASRSAKVHITFSPVTFCVTPGAASVAEGGSLKLSSQGGVAPTLWGIAQDSTCAADGSRCSTLDMSTGAFVAGTGSAGYVLVEALDEDGAETFSEITVGAATGPAPWAAGSGIVSTACGAEISDAGSEGGSDAGTNADASGSGSTVDASETDAAVPVDASEIEAAVPVDETDAAIAADASVTDAAIAADASVTDAAIPVDASETDAGGAVDAASHDAGEVLDAASHDAGGIADSGSRGDSGATKDSGAREDSGAEADSGSSRDGASPYPEASLDAGSGTTEVAGCGCKTAGDGPGSSRLASFGALALFVGVGVRRRRRR